MRRNRPAISRRPLCGDHSLVPAVRAVSAQWQPAPARIRYKLAWMQCLEDRSVALLAEENPLFADLRFQHFSAVRRACHAGTQWREDALFKPGIPVPQWATPCWRLPEQRAFVARTQGRALQLLGLSSGARGTATNGNPTNHFLLTPAIADSPCDDCPKIRQGRAGGREKPSQITCRSWSTVDSESLSNCTEPNPF